MAPSASAPANLNLPARSTTSTGAGTLLLSGEDGGRWEIYATRVDGIPEQISDNLTPARAPALSPDGRMVAFQSHKDGNWDIYILSLDSSKVTRITKDPSYDGAPTWSPDQKKIAFESYRSDDLDIWISNTDGSNPVNLTAGEPAYDYGPAWSPQGNWIAYTSWSTGHKQLYVIDPSVGKPINILEDQFDDEQPAWSPDGKRLAFVSNREGCEHIVDPISLNGCQRREVYTADFDGAKLSNIRQLTFGGDDKSPVWSPDGRMIAFVSPRIDRQALYLVSSSGGLPRPATTDPNGDGSLTWVSSATWGALDLPNVDAPSASTPLYVEKPIAAPTADGHPYEMQELKEIYLAPSWGQMSSRVANSLRTLRARVKQLVGYDFLSSLSDMTRELKSPCGVTCDNLSWHKSGRAIDTRLEYPDASGRDMVELVREELNGETYWRMYLRAGIQDGSMGEPLKDAPWDFSYRARALIAPEQGGIEQHMTYGYYVDFTELAREYGWDRISSHDDQDFNWRSNKLATEYWHYQKADGLGWYDAMREIYSSSDLNTYLEWNKVIRNWQVQEMRLYFKGIPAPPTAWKWFALVP